MRSELVGYVRKDMKGQMLKVHLSVEALSEQDRELRVDSREYYVLTVRADKVREIIDDERDVTAICVLAEDE